ncbi:hypothetical protein [uncultured Enterococcus sp.]|uniref:hypothetical protein n=1 Tax=uncultured Enterococcus sp. TaxID=167972 RepID=UPI002AA84E5A|nr:hypothetical protein [uncultured Enterococcus sp.]
MVNIASDLGAANRAVSGISSISVNTGRQISLGKSNIESMIVGTEVNNQLLSDLSNLISCVKRQSQKFPKIAEILAIEDSKIDF